MSRTARLPNSRRALVLGASLLAASAALACSEEGQRQVELRAAEAVGDLAARAVASNTESGEDTHSRDLINNPVGVRKLADNVYQATGVGSTQVIATSEGHVVYDTGLSIQAAKQRRLLDEALPEGDITHVILSHSHQDHAGGTPFYTEDDPEIVAHYDYPEEQRYLKELEDYFWARNRMLFPFMPESPPKTGFLAYGGVVPTRLVQDPDAYVFEQGGVRFEVLPTPGAEGADNLTLWLPEQKIFFSGDFFGPNFPQFPNVFTMRGEKVRKPVEYIASLERVIALEPEMIVPSHQDPIEGKEKIKADLIKMRDAVRYVHDAVIAGMNAGKDVYQLMEEITLPPELALTQIHGRVSWAVKSIWEYYATWFHFDRTTELYHVPQEAVAGDIAALAGLDALAEAAAKHVAAGRNIHAVHILEIATAADPSHRASLEVLREALTNLREEAKATFNNSYEIDWLKYRLDATAKALGEAG